MSIQNHVDYEQIGQGRYRERNCLVQANSTNVIDVAEFPGLSNDCFKEKFKCSTKFAVSLKNQLLAVITPSRDLELYGLKDDSVVPKCRLRVLHDPHPEYCLLEWSSSQNLLLSTRSTAVVDVFESTGVYCYSLQLGNDNFDARNIISQIITTPATDPDSYDVAYIMQLNSKFSVFKLGKGNMFEPIFTHKLNVPRIYCMAYIPSKHFLIVSTEYTVNEPVSESTKFTDVGLGLFEYRNNILEKKVLPEHKSKWFSFFSETHGAVLSLNADLDSEQILAVTSTGDILLYNVYLELQKFISGDNIIPEARFMQAIFTDGNEMVVLHRNGLIIQENLDTFFDKYLSGELQGTVVEGCEQLYPSIQDEVYALVEKEQSLDGAIVSDNDYVNRFWFFTLFRLNFLYEWIKVLSGAAVGQPMQDVRTDYERVFQFFVYKIKTVTLLQYVKKLLSKRDYIEAEKLAETDENFDMDLVFKQQWLDPGIEIDESLVNVLRKVRDKKWVVQECLSCKSTDSEVQRMILDLAEEAVAEMDSTSELAEKVHNARLIFDCLEETPDMFLQYRSMSLLEAALHFAEDADIDLLVSFVHKHSVKLQNYILMILSLIPEAVPVHKYEQIFPWKELGEERKFVLTGQKFKDTEAVPTEFVEIGLDKYVFTKTDKDPVDFFVDWCKERVFLIDNNSGLLGNAVDLIHTSIDHGFGELKPDQRKFSLYKDFVVFTSAVALTFDKFLDKDSAFVRDAVIKHMKQSDVVDKMTRLVEIFEEFYPKSAAEEMLYLVKKYSSDNFGILLSLYSVRPSYVSVELLTACFLELRLVGPPLVCVLEKFDFEPAICEALQLCADYGYEPQFSHLYEARTSEELASQIFLRFLKCAFKEPELNYILILDSMKKLKKLLFEGLLQDKVLTKVFASELLTKLAKERFMGFPFSLAVDLSSKDAKKLSSSEWQELLLNKSLEFLDRSMPSQKDANLSLAREVLTLTGRQQMNEDLKKQQTMIDIVELSLELGSPRLPSTFRFCDPEMILQEVVSTGKNYRQVKKCGELSKLLKLQQPVAKAMAYCTAEALKVDDISTVEKYIRKLNETCRNMPIVFEICLNIVASGKWRSDDNELVTCMIMNCPSERMYLLSKFLKNQKFVVEKKPKTTPEVQTKTSQTLQKLKDNLDSLMDKEEEPSLVDDGDMHLDPLYCDVKHFHQISRYPNYVPHLDSNDLHKPSVWSPISSTVAVVMASLTGGNENVDWSQNDALNKATLGLKKMMEHCPKGIPLNVLENLSTEVLIKIGGGDEGVEMEAATAIDRVLRHGCDRERFFEDATYRQDSLLGLVMTKDRSMIEDIKEVAEQNKMPLWDLYMAFVEYILTEDEVSPNEAKNFIKEYSLREELWTNDSRLYTSMRASVLPLLPEKNMNKLKLYLTFFKQPEPEFHFFKCLPSIIGVSPTISVKHLLIGQEGVVLSWMMALIDEPDFDDDFAVVFKFFKTLPNAEQLTMKIASFLKITPGLAANRKVKMLFVLVDKKADLLIDQVSNESSSVAEEKMFWNEVLETWDPTADKYEERLLLKIRQHLQKIEISGFKPLQTKPEGESSSAMTRRRGR